MSIREVIARISRIGSSRGFGIQSPSDFSFVCDVVNCRYPYYAYNDLKQTITGISNKERKKAELIFRIANFSQPDTTINLGMEQWYETYISKACQKTKIRNSNDVYNHDDCKQGMSTGHSLMLISCRAPYDEQKYGRYMTDGTILIADSINTDDKGAPTMGGNSRKSAQHISVRPIRYWHNYC